jgi:hypothetical protein
VVDDVSERDEALQAAFRITDRVVGLISTIVWLGFFLIVGLVVVYVWLVVNPHQDTSAGLAAGKIEALMLSAWDRILPIATSVLKLVGPVLVLFLGLALLGALARRGAHPLDLSRVTSDLPSVLALVIIVTICLLPLGGLGVPDALNNIALVVVGFYFGKRDRGAAEPPAG